MTAHSFIVRPTTRIVQDGRVIYEGYGPFFKEPPVATLGCDYARGIGVDGKCYKIIDYIPRRQSSQDIEYEYTIVNEYHVL